MIDELHTLHVLSLRMRGRLFLTAAACMAFFAHAPVQAQETAPEPTDTTVEEPADAPADATEDPSDDATSADADAAADAPAPDPVTGDATDAAEATGADPAADTSDRDTPDADAKDVQPIPSAPSGPETIVNVYECIDKIEIKGAGSPTTVISSQVVIVRSSANRVLIELGSKSLQAKPASSSDDPQRGKVQLKASTGMWNLPPAAVAFVFKPAEKESLEVEGLRGSALIECATILNQARTSNMISSGKTSDYSITLLVDGKDYPLTARQQNGELWVDWMLTSVGTISVGMDEVLLPMVFTLPDQKPANRSMTLNSNASMSYSSARLGPEAITTITTTLTFDGKPGTTTYVRTCQLKPLIVKTEEIPPPATKVVDPRILSSAGPGGQAGMWARSATLALLATQGLAGVRDTGLAIWLAQAMTDTVAGENVARTVTPKARKEIATVDKLSPGLSAPRGFLSQDVVGGSRFRVSLGAGSHMLGETQVGSITFEESRANSTNMSVAMRWKKSPSWLIGFGLVGTTVQSVETAERYWYHMVLAGRLEYTSKLFDVGVAVGPALIWYQLQTPGGVSGADMMGLGTELDLEFKLSDKLGLFAEFARATDSDIVTSENTLFGLRLSVNSNLALRVGMSTVSLSDTEGELGPVEQTDVTAASGRYYVGVMARW